MPSTISTSEDIALAAAMIQRGGVVAMPTETVYGLAADALNAAAVAKIYEIKKRPSFDPLIVHVASIQEAMHIAQLNPLARKLAKAFWPGPFTMVVPKGASIPDIVTSGLPTVGVRMPDHPLALALIRAASRPLAAPSANIFGRVSPTTAEHVRAQLGKAPDAILDGGSATVGLESTIVEVGKDSVTLLRPGAVSQADIEALGIEVRLGAPIHARPLAPGMLASHYATKRPIRLIAAGEAQTDPNPARIGYLAFTTEPSGYGACEVLSASGDLREAAANLFAAMRRLEGADIDLILAEIVPEEGIGMAIMDRLRRAATPTDSDHSMQI